MKLADNYLPKHCRIEDNQVYTIWSNVFKQLFAPPPVLDHRRFSNDPERYTYDLSDVEREFYEKDYLLWTDHLAGKNSELEQYFDPEVFASLRIGSNEKLVFDFLLDRTRQNHYLLGHVGAGKSTLLRYCLLYVLQRSQDLSRQFRPFLFRLDEDNEIFNTVDEGGFSELFCRRILRPKLTRYLEDEHGVTRLSNDPFWKYLEEFPDFQHLRSKRLDFREKYGDLSNPRAWEAICDSRMACRDHKDFPLAALSYVTSQARQQPVLFIDNVDQLGAETCAQLAYELFRIRTKYHVKTLTAMRLRTFDEVRRVHAQDALNPSCATIIQPDMRKFTAAKAQRLLTLVQLPQRPSAVSPAGVKIHLDASKTVESAVQILLHKECLDFLETASQNDLRRWNRIADLYFRSGLLEEHANQIEKLFVAQLDEKSVDRWQSPVPMWIPLVAVLNRNHRTFFSSSRLEHHQDLVPNLLCNGANRLSSNLIRIQILSFLKRYGPIEARSLENSFALLFDAQQRQEISLSIEYALRRLVSCRLVESSARYSLREQDKVEQMGFLAITTYGNQWLNSFLYYYETIVYMKDDVWFSSGVPDGIKSCIEEDHLNQRLRSVMNFIEFFLTTEQQFIASLHDIQRKRTYVQSFSREKSSPLYSLKMANELQRFISKRAPESVHLVNGYEDLVRRARSYEESLLAEI